MGGDWWLLALQQRSGLVASPWAGQWPQRLGGMVYLDFRLEEAGCLPRLSADFRTPRMVWKRHPED